jgi:excisionase family DNA binding protein
MQILLKRPEAAAALGISVRQLDVYIRAGSISVKRLGRRCVRIERTEVERFASGAGAAAAATAVA